MGFAKVSRDQPPQAFILLAPGFDEEWMVLAFCGLRQATVSVQIIGLTQGLMVGKYGLQVRPDLPLAHYRRGVAEDPALLLVIPGGRPCATALLSDPRVHTLLKQTLASGGYLAALSPTVRQILSGIGILTPDNAGRILSPDYAAGKEFFAQLSVVIRTGDQE